MVRALPPVVRPASGRKIVARPMRQSRPRSAHPAAASVAELEFVPRGRPASAVNADDQSCEMTSSTSTGRMASGRSRVSSSIPNTRLTQTYRLEPELSEEGCPGGGSLEEWGGVVARPLTAPARATSRAAALATYERRGAGGNPFVPCRTRPTIPHQRRRDTVGSNGGAGPELLVGGNMLLLSNISPKRQQEDYRHHMRDSWDRNVVYK
eukprot:9286340-Pyramimonas_sp.AAC.1